MDIKPSHSWDPGRARWHACGHDREDVLDLRETQERVAGEGSHPLTMLPSGAGRQKQEKGLLCHSGRDDATARAAGTRLQAEG